MQNLSITKKPCVCSGIRKCALCCPVQTTSLEETLEDSLQNSSIHLYCSTCNAAHLTTPNTKESIKNFLDQTTDQFKCTCDTTNPQRFLKLNGILVLNNFITKAEETYLVDKINDTKWIQSQSGRFKQDYGPKANFKKKKLKCSTFTGLPSFAEFIVHRFSGIQKLKDFVPVELCNLRYETSRDACIDPHYDDFWLWGNRLVTVNLLANTILTLQPGNDVPDTRGDCEIYIPLARRSLIVLSDEARYKWQHSIKKSHVGSTRLAITLRELSDEFRSPSENTKLGLEIEKLALTFQGISVGAIENMNLTNLSKISDKTVGSLVTLEKIFGSDLLSGFTLFKDTNLDLHVMKSTDTSMTICVDSKFVLKVKPVAMINWSESVESDLLKKRFNILEFEWHEKKGFSCCLQKFFLNNGKINLKEENILIKIGKSVAEWSKDKISQNPVLIHELAAVSCEFPSYKDLTLIIRDFNVYQSLVISQLRTSRIDMSIKSKFMAILYNVHEQLKNLDSSGKQFDSTLGLILNDFVPSKFNLENENLISLTCFQNIQYSYFLYDLAKCLNSFIALNEDFDMKIFTSILKGFEAVRALSNSEKEILYSFLLLDLMLNILSDQVEHLTKSLRFFEFFYLNKKLLF